MWNEFYLCYAHWYVAVPFFRLVSQSRGTAELQEPKTEKDLPRTIQLEDKTDLICTKIVQRT